ncbi:MAG TPA: AmmeMemoRadiSam system protein A [Anaerolineales bacterium]
MSQQAMVSPAPDQLSPDERERLLQLARQALDEAVREGRLSDLDLGDLPPHLSQDGIAFVTLTVEGHLRGCVGGLEAKLPLAEDVRQHAVAAGLNDFRFPPVRSEELTHIVIEISRLTSPQPLDYECPEDLLACLHPGVDGVVLVDGARRVTFLPQVWEKIPNPSQFLGMLCQKMGAPADLWKQKKLTVLIYRVEKFRE